MTTPLVCLKVRRDGQPEGVPAAHACCDGRLSAKKEARRALYRGSPPPPCWGEGAGARRRRSAKRRGRYGGLFLLMAVGPSLASFFVCGEKRAVRQKSFSETLRGSSEWPQNGQYPAPEAAQTTNGQLCFHRSISTANVRRLGENWPCRTDLGVTICNHGS